MDQALSDRAKADLAQLEVGRLQAEQQALQAQLQGLQAQLQGLQAQLQAQICETAAWKRRANELHAELDTLHRQTGQQQPAQEPQGEGRS